MSVRLMDVSLWGHTNLLCKVGDVLFQRWKGYLHWRRRQPMSYFEYPPLSNMPIYPKWALGGHRDGFYVAYTRLGSRYFSIGMYFNSHNDPPYRVEVEEWNKENETKAWLMGGSAGWKSLQHHDLSTLEDAEKQIREWEQTLEQVVMESDL